MEFIETKLQGAFLVRMKKIEDQRGFFARGWCRDEFLRHGLNPGMTQLNIGFSKKKGTVRGMHFQEKPNAEAKFVRCTRGAIFDVIIDVRPDSLTRWKWFGVEIAAECGTMLYAPEGFAHGYQTLMDDSEMYYLTTTAYAPSSARGLRYDDPRLGIQWPAAVTMISDQDRQWPDCGP